MPPLSVPPPAPPPAPLPRPRVQGGASRSAAVPGARAGLGGATALLASAALHAAAAAGAIWWGLGRPPERPARLEVAPEAPRLVAVLPALEREPEPEGEPERWLELLPPPEEAPPAPEDDLPEVTLEPEVEAPDPLPRAQPLPLPSDEMARAGRRLRPPAREASPPARPPLPPPTLPPRAAPAPARAARAALVGRTLPTPTWPAGLAWQPAGAVVLLFYVRADGTLADVRVESGSGLAQLDEHVRAFVARTWAFEPTGEPRWARNRFVVAAPR